MHSAERHSLSRLNVLFTIFRHLIVCILSAVCILHSPDLNSTFRIDLFQKALLAKATQSPRFRETLRDTGSKCLVHCYSGDSIYGTGCTIVKVKKWCEEMKASGVTTIRVSISSLHYSNEGGLRIFRVERIQVMFPLKI